MCVAIGVCMHCMLICILKRCTNRIYIDYTY